MKNFEKGEILFLEGQHIYYFHGGIGEKKEKQREQEKRKRKEKEEKREVFRKGGTGSTH